MTYSFKMRGKTYSAATLADLSALYGAARDESGEGNSTFPKPTVQLDGAIIGTLSYNGRIWEGRLSHLGRRVLIYDNR